MELTLKVLSGKNAGREIKVPADKFIIGRAEDCHLRPHSDLISRHHCALLVEPGRVMVRDFGSRNGTFVNGRRIEQPCELRMGDRLMVGQLEFEVQLTSSVGAKRLPKVADVHDAARRAANPRGDASDDDVSRWLSSDEALGEATHETRRLDMTQTDRIPPPALIGQSAQSDSAAKPTEPAEQAETAAKKASEPSKQEKGRFAPAPSPAKNSRDAADEALRKFFRSR